MSRNSYIKGAGILVVGGLMSRFIGLFFKAFITKILGSYAMGLYYNTFFILNFLLSFIISAVPLTLSKMIAEKRALGDYKGLNKIMIIVSIMLTMIGLLFTYIIIFQGKNIILIAGWDKNTYYPLMGLCFAPLLIIYVCIMRGYFQGINDMKPTAVSQIAESLSRLVIGVPMCYYFAHRYGQNIGAGGATFGTTISEACGLIVIFGFYTRYVKKADKPLYAETGKADSTLAIIKRFYSISIPVSITYIMLSLHGIVNSFTYAPRLKVAGIGLEEATKMFGDYSNTNTLVSVPMTISMAVSVALIPAIAESYVKRDIQSIRRKTASALRVIFIVGFPCIVGLSMFSDLLFRLIFNNSPYGGAILRYSSYSILFIMLIGTMQSILQGMDIFKYIIRNIAIGVLIKYLLNYILIAIPALNINGMIISNFISFGVIALLHYRVLKAQTGFRIKIFDTIIKPLFASGVMGVFLALFSNLLLTYFNDVISIFLIIITAMVFYFGILIVTNTIKEEDLDMLTIGKKFKRYYNKYK
ncbi:oligosaccharide flippase family protein [Alkalibaculum sp. M08DMB]|uniref:Oligosaccharide flippase family protein n=1 Tax=Alkalibaculum sporogenes TaxID=2655001 RepID=A0A6A7K659_9FIRM|nr:polysaccharide biosynthesis protein [Alkalibaculum sporogenes]MPW24969.1 oligosaccharide flippase family protein [Alkalibaculum sporogenes]